VDEVGAYGGPKIGIMSESTSLRPRYFCLYEFRHGHGHGRSVPRDYTYMKTLRENVATLT